MDLTDQTISGTNEICLNDSINTSLLKLKVKMTADTVIPSSNDLIIYVDKSTSSTPTDERKQYVFELSSPLKYFNQVGDELVEQISINNNEVTLKATVKRYIGTNDSGNYVLDEILEEIVDSIPITLFEGINYIYTNYSDANITVIYPKDNELNRSFLNNVIYAEHIKNNSSEFNLSDLYFKDAFTKTNNKLNLEVNNAIVDCLLSRNNKFSLDSEGNLTVKSINCLSGMINTETICNLIYPIGSVYISVIATNPAILFGIGVWEQVKDKFLLACGDNYNNGDIGGEVNHTLTISEMPLHNHKMEYNGSQLNSDKAVSGWYPGYQMNMTEKWSTDTPYWNTGIRGENQPHNNMPPYLAVYMWKRTA